MQDTRNRLHTLHLRGRYLFNKNGEIRRSYLFIVAVNVYLLLIFSEDNQ